MLYSGGVSTLTFYFDHFKEPIYHLHSITIILPEYSVTSTLFMLLQVHAVLLFITETPLTEIAHVGFHSLV